MKRTLVVGASAAALLALAVARAGAQGGAPNPPSPPPGAFSEPPANAARGAATTGTPGGPQQPGVPSTVAAATPAPVALPFEAWRFNARERTGRGLAAWKSEKSADAVGALDTAARLKPDDPLAAYNSGTAHLGAGLADAEPILERALRDLDAAPPELVPDGYYNLGNARLAAQNAAGAIDAFKETLRRSPGHAGARRNLEIAQAMLEEQQKKQQQDRQNQQNQDQKDPQQNGSGQPQQSPDDPQGDSEPQKDPSSPKGDPQQNPQDQPQQGQQGADSQRDRPLPQFKDQQDMTAEQAAAILQAVDNLERERRREEAKARARAKTSVEKDW